MALSVFQNWKQTLQVPIICSQCSSDIADITDSKISHEFDISKPTKFYKTKSHAIQAMAHYSENERKPNENSPKIVTNSIGKSRSMIIRPQVPRQTTWMNLIHHDLPKNPVMIWNKRIDVASIQNNELTTRKLQSQNTSPDSSSLWFLQTDYFRDKLPLLSPINEMSNFTFDERVHRILLIFQSLSSIDVLYRKIYLGSIYFCHTPEYDRNFQSTQQYLWYSLRCAW